MNAVFRSDRRRFLKGVVAGGSASLAFSGHAHGAQVASQSSSASGEIPHRPLGKTGLQVSALGVGGFHLGSAKDQQEANAIVALAIDSGVNFFDNAWDYHQGDSEERLGTALQGKRDKVVLMTKVCTHGRNKTVAMRMLEESPAPLANRSPRCVADTRSDLRERSRIDLCAKRGG